MPDPKELFPRTASSAPSPQGASPAEIVRAETALNIKLPAEFKAILQYRNGGKLRLNTLKLGKSPAAKELGKKYRVSELPGIAPQIGDCIIEQTELAREEWDLPLGLIPLFGDGHSWCCLDYRSSRTAPAIIHFETDSQSEHVLADTFEQFISKLTRDSDSPTPALIALDEGAPRNSKLENTLKELGCKRFEPGFANTTRVPAQWLWPKFDSFVKGCECCIEVWRNKWTPTSPVLTDLRPDYHPMLQIYVSRKHEQECLSGLLAVLGPSAQLIHGLD